jgi:hypothetical protein
MKFLTLLTLGMLFFSATSHAKIAIYNNESALKHLLESTELSAQKTKLRGLILEDVSIKYEGTGANKEFTLVLNYGADNGSMLLTRCSVTAVVKSKIKTLARPRITVNELLPPKIQTFCAY